MEKKEKIKERRMVGKENIVLSSLPNSLSPFLPPPFLPSAPYLPLTTAPRVVSSPAVVDDEGGEGGAEVLNGS